MELTPEEEERIHNQIYRIMKFGKPTAIPISGGGYELIWPLSETEFVHKQFKSESDLFKWVNRNKKKLEKNRRLSFRQNLPIL